MPVGTAVIPQIFAVLRHDFPNTCSAPHVVTPKSYTGTMPDAYFHLPVPCTKYLYIYIYVCVCVCMCVFLCIYIRRGTWEPGLRDLPQGLHLAVPGSTYEAD